MEVLILIAVILVVGFAFGRGSRNDEVAKLKIHNDSWRTKCQAAENGLSELEKDKSTLNYQIAQLNAFVSEALTNLKSDSALLPHLCEWHDRLQTYYDSEIYRDLRLKSRPALKAAEEVREARAIARGHKRELNLLRPQLRLYESLAPWLTEFTDCSVQDLLDGLDEERRLESAHDVGVDPVSLYVPKAEWSKMSESDRNQLALDRYWQASRKRSAWMAGIEYERFVGYCYEKYGYRVRYHGAEAGKGDMGIDLICSNDEEVLVIQCKRLSPEKGIPVHENVIAQVYGAAKFYTMTMKLKQDAVPLIVTTYECSKTAREFASHLGVRRYEQFHFQQYPCIKCNISQSTGERIYHLPFDQQYDSTIIGDVKGEFYAQTVTEAENEGFRRAYRWNPAA